MNISIIGYDSSGAVVELGKPLSFYHRASWSGVETKVYLKLDKKPPVSVAKLNVYLNSQEFFSGFVDTLGRDIDETGDYGFISATGYFAKMSQSQVHPQSLTNISSTTIFNTYAKPYGATKNDLLYKAISKLDITAGMTAWDVIDIFCRQAYDQMPMIRKNGVLTVGGFERSDIILGEGGVPYCSLKYIDDRSGMFSRVYMQASENEYDFSIYLDNGGAPKCGIYRERYYKPPKSWKNFTKRGAGEVLRNSNRKRYSYKIMVPQYLELYPGDVIKIKGLGIDEPNFYVKTIKLSHDEKGTKSELYLLDLLST